MSIIRLRDISKRFDRRQVLLEVFFRLEDGARVGLVGNNGSGKATVLRLILGREEPSGAHVDVDNGARIGYFSQFSELSGAVCIEDVLQELFAHIETTEDRLWQTDEAPSRDPQGEELARLLKDYEELMTEMEAADDWIYQHRIDTVLSKLGLSEHYRSGSVAAILVEPTNHLDMRSTQVMERALAHFPGPIVVVSRDRFFVEKVANRLLVFEGDGRVEPANGNWTQWAAQHTGGAVSWRPGRREGELPPGEDARLTTFYNTHVIFRSRAGRCRATRRRVDQMSSISSLTASIADSKRRRSHCSNSSLNAEIGSGSRTRRDSEKG